MRVHQLMRVCKDLQILFRELHRKNIWDQTIEGVSDGETIEEILQESNLILATAVAKSHSKEASLRHSYVRF